MTNLELLTRASKECPCLTSPAHEVCPECHAEGGHSHDCSHCPEGCGKVPLVPGLTKPCPGASDPSGIRRGIRPEQQTSIYFAHGYCDLCGGTQKVPVSEAEALGAMLRYCESQPRLEVCFYHGIAGEAKVLIYLRHVMSWEGYRQGRADGWSVEALAEALCQVLDISAGGEKGV